MICSSLNLLRRITSDSACEDLVFVVDCAPEIHHLALQFDVHLIDMPAPMAAAPAPRDPLAVYVSCEHRIEMVPPTPHHLVAHVDPALEQQILYVT
jgi:hypothetical protein